MPIRARPPRNWEKICAIPTAKVGAPPVRERIEVSPTSRAIWCRMSGVTVKPQEEITCAACSVVVPISAAPLFIAKKTPGWITEAAIIAMTATSDSISMPP